jgi:hypothetical protein
MQRVFLIFGLFSQCSQQQMHVQLGHFYEVRLLLNATIAQLILWFSSSGNNY